MDYVMRIPANKNLELEIEDILFRKAEPEAAGALQELPLSGRELVEAPAGCGQGGAPPRRVVSSRRVHRHEHALAQPLAGAVLQQARTAEQWIKEGKQATNWTRLSCHRFRANQCGCNSPFWPTTWAIFGGDWDCHGASRAGR